MNRIILMMLCLIFYSSLSSASTTQQFIAIADIHFDPLIGCDTTATPCPILNELRTADPKSWDSIFQKYSEKIKTAYLQDTSYPLLQSTLTELQALIQQKKPDFIVIAGDFLPHKFPDKFKQYSNDESTSDYQAFTKKTMQYLTYKLNQAAPTTPIFPALGNNDSYDGNYNVEPNGTFLTNTADMFSTLIRDKNAIIEFKRDYTHAGYYAVTLSKQKQKIIILNTVLFSPLFETPARDKAAEMQFTWLQDQLAIAKRLHQSVLIAFHIPFGIDVFRNAQLQITPQPIGAAPTFFQSNYNDKFISLMQQYQDTISGLIAAHIHRDTFRLINSIPCIFIPSISPIYGNNPGLKIMNYDSDTFKLTNYDAYFYSLNNEKSAQWQHEYNFNTTYQPNCVNCMLTTGLINLKTDKSLIASYKKYFDVEANLPLTNAMILDDWCGIYNLDLKSYTECTTAAFSSVNPAFSSVNPAFSSVIPAFSSVIPAKAGTHSSQHQTMQSPYGS